MPTGSPHLNKAWSYVKLGTIQIGDGSRVVAVVKSSPSKLKTDAKKKAGKTGAKVTTQGLEQRKGSIVVTFLRGAWDYGTLEAQLDEVDPAGVHGGGPFPFEYPGMGPGAPKSVLITSQTRPPEWTGELGTVTMEWEGVTLAAAASGGRAGKGKPQTTEERAQLNAQLFALDQQFGLNTALLSVAQTSAERDKLTAAIKNISEQRRVIQDLLNRPPSTTTSETKNADKNAEDGTTTLRKYPKSAYDKATAPKATP